MAIYTRTGDKGNTSLFGGKRVSKADLRVETYGTVDELNSVIGVALAEIKNQKSKIKNELISIQNDLLSIGSALANPQVGSLASRRSGQKLVVSSLSKRVSKFEALIDQMTAQMPSLKNFILPGGGRAGASLHLARAVCRRLERRLVELVKNQKSKIKDQKAEDGLIIYFNRLSDLLFTLARFANFKDKKKERIWVKNA